MLPLGRPTACLRQASAHLYVPLQIHDISSPHRRATARGRWFPLAARAAKACDHRSGDRVSDTTPATIGRSSFICVSVSTCTVAEEVTRQALQVRPLSRSL